MLRSPHGVAQRRLLPIGLLALAAGWLAGWGTGGGLIYPAAYGPIVQMWRQSGHANARNSAILDSSEWVTVVLPFSMFGSLRGPEMRDDALAVADRELSKGRYGATLPIFRFGIGTVIVINDLRLAQLAPTDQALARERSEAGFLDRMRQVTLAAVLAHEATHSLQFLRGEIYPGPGSLPYPGHDQQDELEAYLNINAIYEHEMGLTLPNSRYESIVRQDYSNLPRDAISLRQRSEAFIRQRRAVDTREGYGRPTDLREALFRIHGTQETSQ